MALTAGSILENRYRIEHLMGRGGMGAVYRAYDLRLQQTVAVKENTVSGSGLSPDVLDAARRQFEREALMLAQLRHPGLPRVIDHFVTPEGNQYLVMDFIPGDDLGQIIARGGPVPEARAIAWMEQACSALEYLHSQKPPIIHRDVKPQNIKVTPQGQVFLVDLGIAKVGEVGSQTMAGAMNVTPGFSPPEQYTMTGTDVRTDIYALGATLYALLTGQVPPDSISLQSGDRQLVPPRQMNSAISPTVQQAILSAMAARRTDRPHSVSEFWRMLSAASGEQKSDTVSLPSMPAPPAPEPQARAARKPWWLALAGAGLVVLIAIGVVIARNISAQRALTLWTPTAAAVLPTARPSDTALPTVRPTDTVPPTARPTDTALPVAAPPTGTLLGAPNPPRTPEQVDAIDLTGKKVTIAFWHERSQRDQELIQAMLDEFNRTNPYSITAQAKIVGTTYSDLYRQVNAAIQAGAPPELSMAFQSQAAVYRAQGSIMDLTPFIQSKKYGLSQSDLGDFYPAMLQTDFNPLYPAERLSFPVQRSMDVLYYNADWLKQLGYSSPPKDWKEFEEMACRAVDKARNKTGWAFRHDATNFATLVFSRGGRLLSEDGKAYVFNSDASVDAVQMIQRMFERGCAVEVPSSENFGEQARFAKAQVLFVLASSTSLSFYADAVSKAGRFKWDIALPPHTGTPGVVLSGASLVIHKTTPEKELAAWLVIRFLSAKQQTTRWSAATGYLPLRASARADTLAGLRQDRFYGPVADLYGKLMDWLPASVAEPAVAGYDAVRLLIDREVMSKVITDPKADVKALLDAAVKKANDTISDR